MNTKMLAMVMVVGVLGKEMYSCELDGPLKPSSLSIALKTKKQSSPSSPRSVQDITHSNSRLTQVPPSWSQEDTLRTLDTLEQNKKLALADTIAIIKSFSPKSSTSHRATTSPSSSPLGSSSPFRRGVAFGHLNSVLGEPLAVSGWETPEHKEQWRQALLHKNYDALKELPCH